MQKPSNNARTSSLGTTCSWRQCISMAYLSTSEAVNWRPTISKDLGAFFGIQKSAFSQKKKVPFWFWSPQVHEIVYYYNTTLYDIFTNINTWNISLYKKAMQQHHCSKSSNTLHCGTCSSSMATPRVNGPSKGKIFFTWWEHATKVKMKEDEITSFSWWIQDINMIIMIIMIPKIIHDMWWSL